MKKVENKPPCPITATLDVLGGKWKVFILSQLVQGTRRFGELKKAIPAVTQKMLTQQLRELEEVGLVVRKIYPEVPPRVEYALTNHGRTLEPVLAALNQWGHQHLAHLGIVAPPPICFRAETTTPDPLSHEALTAALRAATMG